MKQFIRYLYEYEKGKRVRNVGFVKVVQREHTCVINIHGKGLRMEGPKEVDLYTFYTKESSCISYFQGTIESVNPSINYRLEYGASDVGGQEIFDKIGGIILVKPRGKKYAAVWNDMAINVDNMVIENAAKSSGSTTPPASTESSQNIPVVPSTESSQRVPIVPSIPGTPGAKPVSGIGGMPTGPLTPDMLKVSPKKLKSSETTEMPIERQSVEKEKMPIEKADSLPKATEPLPEATQPEIEGMTEGLIVEEPIEMSREEGEEHEVEVESYITPTGHKCEKIQRQDIVKLPRREWRVVNNSFLLHGYYNYHHLVLIQEEGMLLLGVPGVYHEKEYKAAHSFGFPRFKRIADVNIELNEDEQNTMDDFGYWCRPVGKYKK